MVQVQVKLNQSTGLFNDFYPILFQSWALPLYIYYLLFKNILGH